MILSGSSHGVLLEKINHSSGTGRVRSARFSSRGHYCPFIHIHEKSFQNRSYLLFWSLKEPSQSHLALDQLLGPEQPFLLQCTWATPLGSQPHLWHVWEMLTLSCNFIVMFFNLFIEINTSQDRMLGVVFSISWVPICCSCWSLCWQMAASQCLFKASMSDAYPSFSLLPRIHFQEFAL